MTCQQELMALGKPAPRTCQDCGLGPCKNSTPLKGTEMNNDPWVHRSTGMKCATCMWFVGKQHQSMKEGDFWLIGRCRRHAPSMGGYPAVKPDDWCGDHRLDENKI